MTNADDSQHAPAERPSAIRFGLFDIMQVDPIFDQDATTMYVARLQDLAHADEAGIEIAFSAERHFLRHHVVPSSTAWIAAAAQRTSRMRLGMLGYTLPIRQPVQLAEEIAMVDHLSGGRLDVGFGLGHRQEELVALGVEPEQRIRIFQERFAVIQALWSGGQVTYDGEGFTAREVAIWPLPSQEPYPPLWFAGTEPVAAHWMGAHGFGLAVGFKPSRELVGTVASWRAGRDGQSAEQRDAQPGRSVGSLALMRHVYIADTDQLARSEISDDLVRLNEKVKGEAKEGSRTDRRQEAEIQVQKLIDDGVMIAGGPDEVASLICKEQEALGFELMLANVYAAGVEQERVQRTISLFAGPVRERVAG